MGIFDITDKYMEQFNTILLNYYNTGKSEELKQFLYENAIQGMTIWIAILLNKNTVLFYLLS